MTNNEHAKQHLELSIERIERAQRWLDACGDLIGEMDTRFTELYIGEAIDHLTNAREALRRQAEVVA